MKAIAFKISDQLADRLAELYGNRNRGAQRAVENWNDLQILTMFELRNVFSANELKFLIEFIKYKPFISVSDKDIFLMILVKYKEQYNKQIDFDYEELKNYKLQDLTAAQIFFLSDWLDRYWTVNKGKIDVNEYVKFLAKMDK